MSMTLDEAIEHIKEVINDDETCQECKVEHQQLLSWLEELKVRRVIEKSPRFKGFGS